MSDTTINTILAVLALIAATFTAITIRLSTLPKRMELLERIAIFWDEEYFKAKLEALYKVLEAELELKIEDKQQNEKVNDQEKLKLLEGEIKNIENRLKRHKEYQENIKTLSREFERNLQCEKKLMLFSTIVFALALVAYLVASGFFR